jgi:hypothetical protein
MTRLPAAGFSKTLENDAVRGTTFRQRNRGVWTRGYKEPNRAGPHRALEPLAAIRPKTYETKFLRQTLRKASRLVPESPLKTTNEVSERVSFLSSRAACGPRRKAWKSPKPCPLPPGEAAGPAGWATPGTGFSGVVAGIGSAAVFPRNPSVPSDRYRKQGRPDRELERVPPIPASRWIGSRRPLPRARPKRCSG